MTICSLTPARWLYYFTITSSSLILFGWARLTSQHASVCEALESCIGVCFISVTKCLCVQCLCPSDGRSIPCERGSPFAKRGVFRPPCSTFSVIMTLLRSTRIGHALSSLGPSPAPLLNHCACVQSSKETVPPVCRQLEFGVLVWSREEMKMPFIFLFLFFFPLQSSLLGFRWS